MVSLDEDAGRVAVVQMNAELRHAQLEMLSAQCATDRLRLRYSVEDIARHAQRETLRKAWASATALFEYYGAIIKLMPEQDASGKAGMPSLSEAKVVDAIDKVAQYLRGQREHYRPISVPLDGQQRLALTSFFSGALLEQVRVIRPEPQRMPSPPFYSEAKAMGVTNLPELTHMASMTFEDVVVSPEEMTTHNLFHALVHAVQSEVLGLRPYAELFVRGFLKNRSHISVPLEAHAFMLETKFAQNPSQTFSVEEKVRLWTNQGRYAQF